MRSLRLRRGKAGILPPFPRCILAEAPIPIHLNGGGRRVGAFVDSTGVGLTTEPDRAPA